MKQLYQDKDFLEGMILILSIFIFFALVFALTHYQLRSKPLEDRSIKCSAFECHEIIAENVIVK